MKLLIWKSYCIDLLDVQEYSVTEEGTIWIEVPYREMPYSIKIGDFEKANAIVNRILDWVCNSKDAGSRKFEEFLS